jgi:hypothetical protein
MFLSLLDPHPDPLVRGTDPTGSGSASGSVPICYGSLTLQKKDIASAGGLWVRAYLNWLAPALFFLLH